MQAKHTEYSSKADVNSAITSWYSSCAEREPTSCGVSQPSMQQQDVTDDTIRYDTRCYFNVRSKADISPLNLPTGYSPKSKQWATFHLTHHITGHLRWISVGWLTNCYKKNQDGKILVSRSINTVWIRYRDSVDNTVEENYSVFSLTWMNALVAISKGMRAVKLCTNKILQFLTGRAG